MRTAVLYNASSVPPLFLLAASPAPATVEHSIVATRARIAMRSGLCMCDVCGMQYVGQTNNIRLRMNVHKSDYRRFLNGDFSKSDTSSVYSTYNLMILKFSRSKYWKFLKMKVLGILKTFTN